MGKRMKKFEYRCNWRSTTREVVFVVTVGRQRYMVTIKWNETEDPYRFSSKAVLAAHRVAQHDALPREHREGCASLERHGRAAGDCGAYRTSVAGGGLRHV